MGKDKQRDLLDKNYEKLEDDKKETLVSIGENLLNIQNLINREKLKKLTKNQIKRKKK